MVSIDIRGNGESDKPTVSSAYTIIKMGEDILAVVDDCGLRSFAIWGFSYGGNIGRFVAAQSNRVRELIIMGIPFGLAASGGFRTFIEQYAAHWEPIVQAQCAVTLDITSLSADDQQDLQEQDIPTSIAWLRAMLEWGAVEPSDLRCPTLWLVGSANEGAMASVRAHEQALSGSLVRLAVVEGLDHAGEFTEIDQVLPVMLAFTST